MILKATLRVKFRAFGVTFGNTEKSWTVPLPMFNYPHPRMVLVTHDERGVQLKVWLEA